MDIIKSIDKFLLLISDPRNISPEEFAEYYPEVGEKFNPNNLDKMAIEKSFSSIQKFKISEDWNGYISIKAELYLLLELYEKQSQSDKEIFLNYYVLKTKNSSLKTQSFVKEQLLTKKEYFNLLGIYTVFYNNLNSLIINNFKVQISEYENKTEDTIKTSKRKGTIKNKFESFFLENINDNIIFNIKEQFKELENKKMAILVHLLIKNNLIEIDNNNRKEKSRIHFVRSLTGNNHKSIQGINNHLTSVKGELKNIGKDDIQYIAIEKQLTEIVSSCQTTSNN